MGITQQIGASSLIKPGVIDNTAARPASPYEGQVIFQKDTDQLLVWNGTAWVIPNSPAQNPGGLELVKSQVLTGTSNLITNAFSATYDNYKIMFDGNSTMGAVCNINMQMGTTNTGYFSTRIKNAPNSGTPAGNGLDNISEWGYAGQGSPSYANLNMDLFAPFLNRYTRYSGSYMIEIGSGSEFGVTQGHLANSTSYTSFTLAASQTFNATVYVYGYRK